MKLKTFIICLVCTAVAVGAMFFGSLRLDNINSQRSDMKLIANEPLENAPPSLAFATVALGAFRGLIVDVLWIRADQLKEEGKFFDAKQLAEWITYLQPRFASVWDFHAWNMAYNISVAIPASRPQERWQWVQNGYELLRDKGIPKNPKSIILYRSLAWIFQHKIGGLTDDAHKYYKLQLYNLIRPLCGDTQEYYLKLAAAPEKLEDMLSDEKTVEFLNALAAADTVFTDSQKLVDNYLNLRQQPQRFTPETFAVIDNYRGTDTLDNFDIFAKAYYLRNTWKMQPQLMAELNQQYGPIDMDDPNKVLPLDWTHADCHAMYWAALGLQVASDPCAVEYSIDELNTDRIIFHSLQNLYRKGKMVIYTAKVPDKYDPNTIVEAQSIFLFPDLRFFDRYDQRLRTVMEKYAKYGDKAQDKAIQNAHRNTLKRAVLLFYQAGHVNKATEILNTLKKEYPDDPDVHLSMADYTRERLIEELKDIGINDAREIITMLLRDAYYRYAVRDDDEAFGRERMAQSVYEHYKKKFHDEGVDRVMLPEFNVLKYIGITSFLTDLQYPDFIRQNLMKRIEIERPELFKQLEAEHDKFMQQMQQQEQQQQQSGQQ